MDITGITDFKKIKQKLYKSHFLNKDPVKVQKYKKYSNLLNRMKTHAS